MNRKPRGDAAFEASIDKLRSQRAHLNQQEHLGGRVPDEESELRQKGGGAEDGAGPAVLAPAPDISPLSGTMPPLAPRPSQPKIPDTDPYHPEDYAVEIFRLLEEAVDGVVKPVRFTVVDNAMDVIREQLDVYGYAVYTVLYRHSYGYGRKTCALSYAQIAKALRISSKAAERSLADLEARGLIQTLFPPYKKVRGKVYEVILPRVFVQQHIERLEREQAFQELRSMGIL